MENATLIVRPKQVGNSFALFIPAEVREETGITLQDELVVNFHKKKNSKKIVSLFGSLKKFNISWNCKDDRYDENRDS